MRRRDMRDPRERRETEVSSERAMVTGLGREEVEEDVVAVEGPRPVFLLLLWLVV